MERLCPAAARSVLLLPVNFAPWLWGWPNRFLARMAVWLAGLPPRPYDGSGFSSGIDTPTIRAAAAGYDGGIWTNRIDRIAPALQQR